jgi:hypothetical protein
MDSAGSGQGLVTASCEHGHEHSGSIEGEEFLDQLSGYQPHRGSETSSTQLDCR